MSNPRIAEYATKKFTKRGGSNPPPIPGHTTKHPNGYFKPILDKLLNGQMTVRDPEVRRLFEIKSGTKAELKKIVALRCILNAVEGDNVAIKELFERMDGKVAQKLLGEGLKGDTNIIIVRPNEKEMADWRKKNGNSSTRTDILSKT